MLPLGGKTIMMRWKVLIIAGAVTLVVLGLGLVAGILARSGQRAEPGQRGVDYLAQSSDSCVECHRRTTPGIVEQYGKSTMAAAKVSCRDCHVVEKEYPGAKEHEGAFILASPTTARCARCHANESAQFMASRHSLPSYVAYAGTAPLSPEHRKLYDAIPEGQAFDKMRNALFAIEGKEITKFAC
ncbi:MAG TPA: cytochrome c3 family protein, partial [Planctomycetota bacterium]|nr:cytochrome c3 family protein [Planctomycetota bacterium]